MRPEPVHRLTAARLRALLAEHARARSQLSAFARLRSGSRPSLATVESLVRYVAGPLAAHALAEERELFPALVDGTPELGYALEPLRADHVELRDLCDALREWLGTPRRAGRDEQLGVLTRDLTDLLRLHLEREERTAYAWAARLSRPRRAVRARAAAKRAVRKPR